MAVEPEEYFSGGRRHFGFEKNFSNFFIILPIGNRESSSNWNVE